MHRSLVLLAALLGLAALAALPAQRAEAIPFGADLNRPANNTIGCETAGIIPNPSIPGQLITLPSGIPTCTWLANGRVGDFAETLAVPTSGTVTQIQVKVGPVTGPMQVVVYSSLGIFDPNDRTKPPSTACCQVRALSQVFTPAPNAVTTVAVNLPVVTEKVPPPGTNILRGDGLALSVLAPNVPVPAHNTGNFNALTTQVGGSYHPALGPGEERTSPAGLVGFQVLLRADVTPTGAGGAGGAGGSGGAGDAGGSGGAGDAGSSSSARCAGKKATIVGTNGADKLRGTRKRDVIAGLGGNDVIRGLAGNDIICGGPGNDRILAGAGNDRAFGQGGNDRVYGQGGNDRLYGQAGRDFLFGQAGNDRAFGGAGNDVLYGHAGRDRLDGQAGSRDRLIGGPANDVCRRGRRSAC